MNKLVERLQKSDFPVLFYKKDLKRLEFERGELKELFDEAMMKYMINHIYGDIYTLAHIQ